MRVALVSNAAQTMVWFRLPLIRALQAAGHEVTVVTPPGPGVDLLAAAGAHHQALPASSASASLRDGAVLARLGGVLRRLRPDVVVGYTPKMSVMAAVAARVAGVPRVHAVWTGLGMAGLGRMRRRHAAALALGARLSDHVVVLNPDNLERVVTEGLMPASKCRCLDGEGVSLARFDGVPPRYAPGQATVLMAARLLSFKGVHTYAEAARRLAPRHPGTRFLLAGAYDPRHPAAVAPQDLPGLEWLDVLDPIDPLLLDSDIVVLPSHEGEGLPMSLLEAMAAARPIVTTDVPGNRELAAPGERVPPRDAAALAEAIAALLDDPEAAVARGRAGRERCAQRFAASVVVPRWVAHITGYGSGVPSRV